MLFGLRRPSTAKSTKDSGRAEVAGDQAGAASDEDAFSAEALAMIDGLYGMALRLTRDGDRAQDLVQDTYLKAFRARHRFVPGTNLKAWLFTILQNTWRNRRRDQARARIEFDSEVVEAATDAPGGPVTPLAENPEMLLLRANFNAELKAALDALPAIFREAVWLRDVEELTYQEIADVLSIPLGTVMSRIARGRKQLHQLLLAAQQAPALAGSRN
jgi:RNA polymerase sigma-70 factor (ECF subfamily)